MSFFKVSTHELGRTSAQSPTVADGKQDMSLRSVSVLLTNYQQSVSENITSAMTQVRNDLAQVQHDLVALGTKVAMLCDQVSILNRSIQDTQAGQAIVRQQVCEVAESISAVMPSLSAMSEQVRHFSAASSGNSSTDAQLKRVFSEMEDRLVRRFTSSQLVTPSRDTPFDGFSVSTLAIPGSRPLPKLPAYESDTNRALSQFDIESHLLFNGEGRRDDSEFLF